MASGCHLKQEFCTPLVRTQSLPWKLTIQILNRGKETKTGQGRRKSSSRNITFCPSWPISALLDLFHLGIFNRESRSLWSLSLGFLRSIRRCHFAHAFMLFVWKYTHSCAYLNASLHSSPFGQVFVPPVAADLWNLHVKSSAKHIDAHTCLISSIHNLDTLYSK